VPCRVVAPAANVPYGPGAVDVLAGRRIVALADFVTNAGGVHLFQAAGRGESPEQCLRTVGALVSETTERVLDSASATGTTPLVAAQRLAADFLLEAAAAR
jgi:leucine dehydrogenase